MTETDEKVLCVGKVFVDEILGRNRTDEENLQSLLNQKTYRNRHTPNDDGPDVEHDDRWKQLIPYIVCVNGKGQILAYNRGSKGGEKRLENLWSIGVGGHVNNQDADWMAGVWREIREELSGADSVAYGYTAEQAHGSQILYGPIGFIDDNSDPVGQHHTGVVYVLRASEVVPRENPEYSWQEVRDLSISQVWGRQLESWAVLALPMVREWMESEGT